MHIPVVNTAESHITLKKVYTTMSVKGKPIGQVTELEECTENINAAKNYDLSDNNLVWTNFKQWWKTTFKKHRSRL